MKSQKEFTAQIADKIERGIALNEREQSWAAAALRSVADSIPDSPRRRREPGPKACVDTPLLIFWFVVLKKQLGGANKAYSKLAEMYELDERGVRRRLNSSEAKELRAFMGDN